jgi:hypothetical protein
MGGYALENATGGSSNNVAFGVDSMRAATSASNSVGVGTYAGMYATDVSESTLVGAGVLQNLNSACSSITAVGFGAGHDATSVGNSTYVGYQAGTGDVSGTGNTCVGYGAGVTETNSAINYSTAIGYNSLATESQQIMLGTDDNSVVVPGDFSSRGVYFGPGAAGITSNVAVGTDLPNTTGGSTTVVGVGAANSQTTGVANTVMGYYALESATGGSDHNVAMGTNSARYATSASNSVSVGSYSGLYAPEMTESTLVGANVLNQFNTACDSITAVGYNTGLDKTSGSQSTYIGFQAGTGDVSGTGNTCVGYGAGVGAYNATTQGSVSNSVSVGNGALANVDSVAVGGAANATGGAETGMNVAIGCEAQVVDSESNSIAIGPSSVCSGSGGNISLGSGATCSGGTSVALGYGATCPAGASNSVALGANAICSEPNQIMLGTSAESVIMPGPIFNMGQVSGVTLIGTGIVGSSTDYTGMVVPLLASCSNVQSNLFEPPSESYSYYAPASTSSVGTSLAIGLSVAQVLVAPGFGCVAYNESYSSGTLPPSSSVIMNIINTTSAPIVVTPTGGTIKGMLVIFNGSVVNYPE